MAKGTVCPPGSRSAAYGYQDSSRLKKGLVETVDVHLPDVGIGEEGATSPLQHVAEWPVARQSPQLGFGEGSWPTHRGS